MDKVPDRVSPLEQLAIPGHFGSQVAEPKIELSERFSPALVQIQAWPDSVGATINAIKQATGILCENVPFSAGTEDCQVLPIGPGRWLVDSENEGLTQSLQQAISVELAAVTGLTHARVIITVQGEKATWLLASGIALDFDLDAFPVGTVQLSHHHEIGLTIHRVLPDEFDIYVFSSLARSFWHWLERAASEVGYKVS